jgi:hypothetical protein
MALCGVAVGQFEKSSLESIVVLIMPVCKSASTFVVPPGASDSQQLSITLDTQGWRLERVGMRPE